MSHFPQITQPGADLGNPESLASAVCELEGYWGECLTWMVGKVLWLTSFSLSVDDVEVHFYGYSDVLVPILGDLNKKHVLEGSSCHELDCKQYTRIPAKIPIKSTQAHHGRPSGFVPHIYSEGNLTFHPSKKSWSIKVCQMSRSQTKGPGAP